MSAIPVGSEKTGPKAQGFMNCGGTAIIRNIASLSKLMGKVR
jgi:hypothetical protein